MFLDLQKKIAILFYLLLFSVPLILFPKTSELFEFNKMVFTYFLTILIVGLWTLRMTFGKKFIFKRTILDIPLIVFLVSQFLATIFSIDTFTSIYGYYSRFHGGLLSSLCYALLYWSFVSNMTKEHAQKSLRIILFSGVITSVWGIFEHFGRSFSCFVFPEFRTFDVSCWVQDVQNRVFSTFGQPNWLAAWLTAAIPITWGLLIDVATKKNKLSFSNRKLIFYFSISLIFFITLLFTKSRSGILGFLASFVIFWVFAGLKSVGKFKRFILPGFLVAFPLVIATLTIGTPWSPKISELASSQLSSDKEEVIVHAPALETGGGTESGKIRQIVWEGALDIWKNYPLLGSGVETFAYAYYQFRPMEHNSVSEWDYLYNKAHNEYLNFAATTGILGLFSYLFLIFVSLFAFVKEIKVIPNKKTIKNNYTKIGLMSGYVSILITNFFGFSVVPVALFFFLFPAFLYSYNKENDERTDTQISFDSKQKIYTALLLLLTFYLLFLVAKYWYTDFLYAKAQIEAISDNQTSAREIYLRITKAKPGNALYWDELAETSTALSISHLENNDTEVGKSLALSALTETATALALSPANVNLKRNASARYIQLSSLDPKLLDASLNILLEAQKQAPTDPKIIYNLSLAHLRTGNYESAIEYMEEAIKLKPDYEKARYSVALMYIDMKREDNAKSHLMYILEKINPNNEVVQKELDELAQ